MPGWLAASRAHNYCEWVASRKDATYFVLTAALAGGAILGVLFSTATASAHLGQSACSLNPEEQCRDDR